MRVLCVVGLKDAREAELAGAELLSFVPRVAVEEAARRVWGDVHGLPADAIAARALRHLGSRIVTPVQVGVADSPVAAAAAAHGAAAGHATCVARGGDRTFLAPLPLRILEPEPALLSLLTGVGIECCATLAALPRESVEVRFGAAALEVWQRARAEDTRVLFRDRAPHHLAASLDFIDYVVTDPERLLFTANALLGGICDGLRERGAHARRIEMTLPLANGEVWRRALTPARPTASRSAWLRLVRGVLERLTVPDAVAGMRFDVRGVEAALAVQGDLFDAGFGTAAAVEAALARLVETWGTVLVQPETTAHPLIEQSNIFTEIEPDAILEPGGERVTEFHPMAPSDGAPAQGSSARAHPGVARASNGAEAELTLQVLPEPRLVPVQTAERRDHLLPTAYRDGAWHRLLTVEGPDRVSGGQWAGTYAREYFRGLTDDGRLVWLFRDGLSDAWYLHGWWD